MKATIVSILLFLSLLGFVIYADNSLDNLCDNIEDKCTLITRCLEKDNYDDAYDMSKEILVDLNDRSLITSIYVNHTDYDTLYCEALRLSAYIYKKDKSKSYNSTKVLKCNSHIVKSLHKTNLKNIF